MSETKNPIAYFNRSFATTLTACAPVVNFGLPSEQRVTIDNRGSQGYWTADLVYTPIDPEDMVQELPKSKSYIYVALLTNSEGRDRTYGALVNTDVDTEANIKETGFEIKNIRYYHVHLENLSEKATPDEINFQTTSLKYV